VPTLRQYPTARRCDNGRPFPPRCSTTTPSRLCAHRPKLFGPSRSCDCRAPECVPPSRKQAQRMSTSTRRTSRTNVPAALCHGGSTASTTTITMWNPTFPTNAGPFFPAPGTERGHDGPCTNPPSSIRCCVHRRAIPDLQSAHRSHSRSTAAAESE